MNWLLLTAVLANPVPTVRANPLMTEDEAVAFIQAWKLHYGSEANPRPKVLGEPQWRTWYVGVQYESGFVGLGCGTTLEIALRQLVERVYIRDRAKVQEFLRRR